MFKARTISNEKGAHENRLSQCRITRLLPTLVTMLQFNLGYICPKQRVTVSRPCYGIVLRNGSQVGISGRLQWFTNFPRKHNQVSEV